MNTAQSTDRSPAVAVNKRTIRADCSLGFDALMIRIIRGGIGNLGLPQKCGNFSTERLSSKTGNAPSVTKSSQITTTSCQITEIPGEWEGRGEMTIRTTSGQFTGGAILKKDQRELPNDGRSVGLLGKKPKFQDKIHIARVRTLKLKRIVCPPTAIAVLYCVAMRQERVQSPHYAAHRKMSSKN